MKMLLRGLMVAAVAFLCVSAAQAQQVEITVDKDSTQSGSLGDFPVLVKLNNARTNNYTGMAANGSNLAFYQGATPLAYEIENFDNAGTSNIWVRVPVINTGGATTITAKWGAGQAATLPTTDVWSNGFLGVYHMSETSGTTAFDSSNTVVNGNILPGIGFGTGRINGGYTSQGKNYKGVAGPFANPTEDAVLLGDNFKVRTAQFTNLNERLVTVKALAAMSASIWFKPGATEGQSGIMGRGDGDSNQPGAQWHMEVHAGLSDGWIRFLVIDDINDNHLRMASAKLIVIQETWHKVVGTWDGGTDSASINLYLDGVNVNDTFDTKPNTDPNSLPFPFAAMRVLQSQPQAVFGSGLIANIPEQFGGIMDEARISDVARRADWVLSQYLSEVDNYNEFGNVVP